MDSLASLYKNHIVTLQERTRDVLARFKLDALLIHSGELMNTFLDDHAYPFKVNPQFKAWVPVTQVPNCWHLRAGSYLVSNPNPVEQLLLREPVQIRMGADA